MRTRADHTPAAASLAAAAARALAEGATFRAVHDARVALAPGSNRFAAVAALEDALRTADFADAGRLILVRSLTLKNLPRGASGPLIARALERVWHTLAPAAVPFDAPGAERAEVVYFRSVMDARLAWLQCWLTDAPCNAWFWPRAIPELAANGPRDAVVPLLVMLQSTAPAALAKLLRALPAAALSRLHAQLPQGQVALLLPAPLPSPAVAAADETTAPAAEHGRAMAARAQRVQQAWRELPASWTSWLLTVSRGERLAQDWRAVWLVSQVIAGQASAVAARSATVAELAQDLVSAVAGATLPVDLQLEEPAPSAHDARAPAPSERSTRSKAHQARADTPAHTPSATSPTPAPRRRQRSLLPLAAYPWLAEGAPTGWAGLLMLLNALQMLGLPAWLAAQPEAVRVAFTRALLAAIADRLSVPADDPQRVLMTLDAADRSALLASSCHWDRFAWPRRFDSAGLAPRDASVPAALRCWQRALGRLLRRHARVGWLQLTRVPGAVVITPTHVDVVLPLSVADADVRIAGLDRDPGWVPWFGWIVSFHFIERGGGDGAG